MGQSRSTLSVRSQVSEHGECGGLDTIELSYTRKGRKYTIACFNFPHHKERDGPHKCAQVATVHVGRLARVAKKDGDTPVTVCCMAGSVLLFTRDMPLADFLRGLKTTTRKRKAVLIFSLVGCKVQLEGGEQKQMCTALFCNGRRVVGEGGTEQPLTPQPRQDAPSEDQLHHGTLAPQDDPKTDEDDDTDVFNTPPADNYEDEDQLKDGALAPQDDPKTDEDDDTDVFNTPPADDHEDEDEDQLKDGALAPQDDGKTDSPDTDDESELSSVSEDDLDNSTGFDADIEDNCDSDDDSQVSPDSEVESELSCSSDDDSEGISGYDADLDDTCDSEKEPDNSLGPEADPQVSPAPEADPNNSLGPETDPDDIPGPEADADNSPGLEADPDDSPGLEADTDNSPGPKAGPDNSPGPEADPDDSPGPEVDPDKSLGPEVDLRSLASTPDHEDHPGIPTPLEDDTVVYNILPPGDDDEDDTPQVVRRRGGGSMPSPPSPQYDTPDLGKTRPKAGRQGRVTALRLMDRIALCGQVITFTLFVYNAYMAYFSD